MLSTKEREARVTFYGNIFGLETISKSPFPSNLWSIASYDEKIRGLTERGFKDPQKMITSLPTILGYSFENIDQKLKLCRRLDVNVRAFIACTVVFIGMSAKHYIPILRKCRKLAQEPNPRNVFRIYRSKTF